MVSLTPRPVESMEEAPDAHWIRGWVGPRTGLDLLTRKKKFFIVPWWGID